MGIKVNKLFLLSLVFILLIINITIAFDPKTTHPQFVISVCNSNDGYSYVSNPYKDVCCGDLNHCIAGVQFPDIAIADYFSLSGKGIGQKYKDTHSALFCKLALSEAKTSTEKACAVGSCLHLVQDTISHNNVIPFSITESGIVNAVIHAPTEIKFGEDTINKYGSNFGAEVEQYGTTSFNYVDDCMLMYERVLTSDYMEQSYNSETLYSRVEGFKTIFATGTYKQFEFSQGISAIFKIAPWYVGALIILGLISSIIFLMFLIKKLLTKSLSKLNIFFDLPLTLIILFVCGVLVIGALTGNLYNVVIFVLTKLFFALPTMSSGSVFDAVHNYQNQFFMLGSLSSDNAFSPSGEFNILKADEGVGNGMYYVIIIVVLVLITRLIFALKRRK